MNQRPGSVLHVTEALGGGVLYAIAQLANSQVERGWTVALAHSIRLDTPSSNELDEILLPQVTRVMIPMVTAPNLKQDILSIVRIWHLIRCLDPAIIHLHSSKAGVVGRLAGLFAGCRRRLFYTPHGYAFLREDVSELKRGLFLLFERIASFVGGNVIACSPREAQLASQRVFARHVQLVENAVSPRVSKISTTEKKRLKVVTVGRISPQKAPKRFRVVAERLSHLDIDFVWIGDGESRMDLINEGETKGAVSITGWLSRERVQETLLTADVFLLLSRWEGLPLALIEAQLVGLPVIASDIDGCREIIVDGVTGFICGSDDEVISRLQCLVDDEALREKMGRAARSFSTGRFALDKMIEGTLVAYGGYEVSSIGQT